MIVTVRLITIVANGLKTRYFVSRCDDRTESLWTIENMASDDTPYRPSAFLLRCLGCHRHAIGLQVTCISGWPDDDSRESH